MKKSEIKILLKLEEEKSQEALKKELNLSQSYISRALNSLLKKGIIEVKTKQKKKLYSLSKNPFSALILKILKKNPKILEGKKESLLSALWKPKSLVELQIETNIYN